MIHAPYRIIVAPGVEFWGKREEKVESGKVVIGNQ